MKTIHVNIHGPILIEPKVFGDERGFFFESFKKSSFENHNLPTHFVQDNHSRSAKGVLRGLHFQIPPYEQGKLVRVVRGSVIDVFVDIRKGSATYGYWDYVELSDKNKKILWIPSGFAHGFLTLEDDTDFLYKVTSEYSPQNELGIAFDDIDLNIPWSEWLGSDNFTISERDKKNPRLKDFQTPFE